MTIHPWWEAFGTEVTNLDKLTPALARELASLAARGELPGVTFVSARERHLGNLHHGAVYLDIDVQRPQDLVLPIKASEPIAVAFPVDGSQPSVLALRGDFPDTPHQNWVLPGGPCCLCIDDRPWAEAKLTTTASDIVRRVQLWLAKAARGDLHDAAQPLDPLFFTSSLGLILPSAALLESAEPVKLTGHIRADNESLIIARITTPSDKVQPAFTVLALKAMPQGMSRLRHALGALLKNEVGNKSGYVVTIAGTAPAARDLAIEPVQVYFSLDRSLAATIAGRASPDRRRVVLVGAGSLGSQLGIDLAREGAFQWTVVDNDHVLPHNLVRHALFERHIGAPKAIAVAHEIGQLIGEPAHVIRADVLKPDEKVREQLRAAFAESNVILDMSASVAVSRHLSDLADVSARRVCGFFNPQGTAVVLMAENADRTITLRDLEAQYHRIALTDPTLSDHLATGTTGVRYSGSCRALTNRIPGTNAAILSAIAAQGVVGALATKDATISIWSLESNGQVRLVRHDGAPVMRVTVGSWSVACDVRVFDDLAQMRQSKLPRETGGILLGIADMAKKLVHVAYALPEPDDSRGSTTGFVRGTSGLLAEVSRLTEATMYQLRYVGEWHSHPDRASPAPSATDLAQVMWLGRELESEGLPALMAIAGQDDKFGFVVGRTTGREGEQS